MVDVTAPRLAIVPVRLLPLAFENVAPLNTCAAVAFPVAFISAVTFANNCAQVSLVVAATPLAISAATSSAFRSLPAVKAASARSYAFLTAFAVPA
ncbi:hypothetical protein D3C74_433730 [compost metagenome]